MIVWIKYIKELFFNIQVAHMDWWCKEDSQLDCFFPSHDILMGSLTVTSKPQLSIKKRHVWHSILSCLYGSLLIPYILDAVLYFLVFIPPRSSSGGINRNHSVCSSVHPSSDLFNFCLLWHWHTIFGSWMYHHETGGYP